MTSKIAFVFPGQGSQSVNMLREFTQPIVTQTFQEASEILSYDVKEVINNNPPYQDKLHQTEITQPVLLASSVALWRLWCAEKGPVPAVMAGHSLGEYSALVCAEALSFADALLLVQQRGRFMQEAVPQGQGAMAAIIGLSPEEINHICEESAQGEVVSAANINAPSQIVIGGNIAAVTRAMKKAEDAGAKLVIKLEMSVPSHCALMYPAAEKLKNILEKLSIQKPKIPVIHNLDASSHQDVDAIKQVLFSQLFSPVQWVNSIENIVKKYGITKIIECGPGKVLTGLNRRIVKEIPAFSLSSPALFEEALKTCLI